VRGSVGSVHSMTTPRDTHGQWKEGMKLTSACHISKESCDQGLAEITRIGKRFKKRIDSAKLILIR
jgi:hypothetical protein